MTKPPAVISDHLRVPETVLLPNRLVPPVVDGLIARHRLFKQIDQAPLRGAVWVTAPPGSGKSSLAATWLACKAGTAPYGHAIWYRIDETGADPSIFFEDLKRAVSRLPDAPLEALPVFRPEALPEIKAFADSWFQVLLATRARAPYFFIFDDVHRLPPDSVILEIMAILASRLQPKDRLLCLSRQEPPPGFATHLPAPLTEITDLQVQPDEFEDFKRDAGQAEELTGEVFLARLRQSGQWISDMVAAASPHPSLHQLRTCTDADPGQVLAGFDDQESKALLATAFLQAGHEEEWRALAGQAAAEVLTRLGTEGGLVTRLVNGALRKHDLFHERLAAAAQKILGSEALRRARREAGRLLSQRGELLSGVALLIKADAHDEALDVTLSEAQTLLASGQNRELLDLIGMLPESHQMKTSLRVWSAYGLLPFEPRQAHDAFARIRRETDPGVEPQAYALAVCGEVRAALEDWSVDERMRSIIVETDSILPLLEQAPESVQRMITLARGMAMLVGWPDHPNVADARCEVAALLPLLPPDLQLTVGMLLVHYMAWLRGDLAAARLYLSSLKPLVDAPEVGPLAMLGWYNSVLTIAFRDGDDETLRQAMEDLKAYAYRWGLGRRLASSLWIAAQAYAAMGDRMAAAEALHHYEALVPTNLGAPSPRLHSLRAAIALSAGDEDGAVAHARQAGALITSTTFPYDVGNQAFVLAQALAIKGDSTAKALILDLRDLGECTGNAGFQLHALLAETSLAHAQGRLDEFLRLWEDLVDLACQIGFRRLIGMNAEHLSRLANAALSLGAGGPAARRLIELWRLAPPRDSEVSEHWPYPVEIFSLGGFAIQINGEKARAAQGKAQRKPLELLWLLIVANGRGVLQDLLADELWPDLEGDRAMHTLRTTIYRLRKMIGAEAVVQENDHVRLDMTYVATDLGRLRTALERMLDQHLDEASRGAAFDQVLRLYRGALLPGVALASVIEERERLVNEIVTEALGFLMTLDSADPATLLRVQRLRMLAPDALIPAALARLWTV